MIRIPVTPDDMAAYLSAVARVTANSGAEAPRVIMTSYQGRPAALRLVSIHFGAKRPGAEARYELRGRLLTAEEIAELPDIFLINAGTDALLTTLAEYDRDAEEEAEDKARAGCCPPDALAALTRA